MTRKLSLRSALVGLGLAAAAIAPAASKSPGTSAKPRASRLGSELSLTPDQDLKIKTIDQQFHDRMKALQADHDRQVEAVLTPDQAAKWGQVKQGQAVKRQATSRERKIAKLQSTLSLSAAQAARIRTILTTEEAQQAALKAGAAQPGADAAAIKKQASALRKSTTAQIDAVLTPEQRVKYHTRPKRLRKTTAAASGG